MHCEMHVQIVHFYELYESLIFLSWSISLLHIFLENITKNYLIGAILSPTTLFINSFANLNLPLEMQKITPLIPALQSNWLMMHVTVMLLSYATLIGGTLISISFLILYFLESQTLKNYFLMRQINFENSLNSNLNQTTNVLEKLDDISYRLIGIGFLFLTIGILSGSIWANEAWGSYWSWDPKETWALITWIIFAIYLHIRFIKGIRGLTSSILASFGFFTVWICYLGVNVLGKGLHSYGWLN